MRAFLVFLALLLPLGLAAQEKKAAKKKPAAAKKAEKKKAAEPKQDWGRFSGQAAKDEKDRAAKKK